MACLCPKMPRPSVREIVEGSQWLRIEFIWRYLHSHFLCWVSPRTTAVSVDLNTEAELFHVSWTSLKHADLNGSQTSYMPVQGSKNKCPIEHGSNSIVFNNLVSEVISEIS